MQLGRHLEKGFWSFAIQILIALYGVAFMVLVVRVLPPQEFGQFVLIQMTFLILGQIGSSFAFAPMVKYLYDYEDRRVLITHAVALGIITFIILGSMVWLLRFPLARLFNTTGFGDLAYFVPLLMFAAFGKYFTHQLLRGLYRIRRIFFMELTYYGLALGLIVYINFTSGLHTAAQLLKILVIAFIAASGVGFWLSRDQLKFNRHFNLECLRTLINYGKYILGLVINGQIYDRADVFMIAAIVGPVEVAIYQSAKLFVRIIEMYRQVVGLLAMPTFSRLQSENRQQDIKAVYEKGILFSHILLVPLAILLIILAKPLYQLIYAGKYLDGVIILQIFALMAPLFAWQSIGEGLLNGLGYPNISFSARTATTFIKIVLNLVLIYYFKSVGAALASLVAISILAIIVTRAVKSKVAFSLPGIAGRIQDIVNFVKSTGLQLKEIK
ncbi:MAG: hypothetical protein D6813_04200 [Calditrichaeota bacterium]|nr:MAG: hypothetical protein D6813_04200 [Calditrichota bacterium]